MRLDPPKSRWVAKVTPALPPLAVLRNHILSEKNDRRGPADQLVVVRVGIRRDQPEHRGSVGRGNRHQAVTRLKVRIQNQMESELIHVEFETAILIFDKDVDSVNPQVGVLAVQANGGSGAAHAGDYRT